MIPKVVRVVLVFETKRGTDVHENTQLSCPYRPTQACLPTLGVFVQPQPQPHCYSRTIASQVRPSRAHFGLPRLNRSPGIQEGRCFVTTATESGVSLTLPTWRVDQARHVRLISCFRPGQGGLHEAAIETVDLAISVSRGASLAASTCSCLGILTGKDASHPLPSSSDRGRAS